MSFVFQDPQSFSGQKLLRKADFHLGSYVTQMQRIAQPSPLQRDSMFHSHFVVLSMVNGSIGYVTPIHEEIYRRLYVLHSKLALFLQHSCGLNPRAFRTYQSVNRQLTNSAHNMIDGQLVYDFLNLPRAQQRDLARQVGMSSERIQTELIRLSAHHEFF
jgi:cleavage and polyadenylation specificity factor subunit 1